MSCGYALRLLGSKAPAPEDVQKTVKMLLLGLVVLDGILVAGACNVYWALAVWALLVPAVVVSRRFYVT